VSAVPKRRARIVAAERAGAIEPFRDAALYDWEYRRRRADVAFYRMLADERGGPILDLGCGTGRLLIPLLRDGHRVVGVDLSAPMLARAAARRARLPRHQAARGLLLRGDLRRLPVRGPFPLITMAFHTIQHLVDDADLVGLLRAVHDLLTPDGWFAFDVFFPSAAWLARPSNRRFDHTLFRHPHTRERMEYSVSHRLDRERRALHMFLHYRELSAPRGRIVRLCHRQLPPDDVAALLAKAGLKVIARWGGWRNEPLEHPEDSEQHVYLVRRAG
jgi:SAM-dependent methyltransferase